MPIKHIEKIGHEFDVYPFIDSCGFDDPEILKHLSRPSDVAKHARRIAWMQRAPIGRGWHGTERSLATLSIGLRGYVQVSCLCRIKRPDHGTFDARPISDHVRACGPVPVAKRAG